jgi:chromosome partitioning protein
MHSPQVVAVVAEKGGVGKTHPFADAGGRHHIRGSQGRRVGHRSPIDGLAAIEQARMQGADFIVIDTPPHSSADATEAARRADLVLAPVEPHLFTLETLPKLADNVEDSGALVVINKAAVQGTEAKDAMEHVRDQGFEVCPVVLHLRAAHRHAGNVGKVALEHEPSGKAADEAIQVYD